MTEPEPESVIIATPRGAVSIKVVLTDEGYTLNEFEPELRLGPGDIVEVTEGVITGVLATTDDYILEVIFHPNKPFKENAALVDLWSRRFKAQLTTPGSACVASPNLEAMHPVGITDGVLEAELLRIPLEVVNLTTQVKSEFPVLPTHSD